MVPSTHSISGPWSVETANQSQNVLFDTVKPLSNHLFSF